MSSNFPAGYDTFTTKLDNIDRIYADHVNKLQDATGKIELELGLGAKGAAANLTDRLATAHDGYGNIVDYYYNTSGSTLVPGQVVIVDTLATLSITLSGGINNPDALGVVTETTLAGELTPVCTHGTIAAYLTAELSNINIGDTLTTALQAGFATRSDNLTRTILGRSNVSLTVGSSGIYSIAIGGGFGGLSNHAHAGANDGGLLGDDVVDSRILKDADDYTMANLITTVDAHVMGKLTVDGAIDPTELDMGDDHPIYFDTAKLNYFWYDSGLSGIIGVSNYWNISNTNLTTGINISNTNISLTTGNVIANISTTELLTQSIGVPTTISTLPVGGGFSSFGISLTTGSSTVDSGDITLQTGAASGIRGTIILDSDIVDVMGIASYNVHPSFTQDTEIVDKKYVDDAATGLNLGTAAVKDTGTIDGTIPLIGAGDKLPSSIIPAVNINDTYVVGSSGDQLALTVVQGDVAVRTDENKSYINTTGNNASMSDWQELLSPGNVLVVNGQTGIVVLTADDVGAVSNTGDETIDGIKTFTSFIVTPTEAPSADYQVANKKYVDDRSATGSLWSRATPYTYLDNAADYVGINTPVPWQNLTINGSGSDVGLAVGDKALFTGGLVRHAVVGKPAAAGGWTAGAGFIDIVEQTTDGDATAGKQGTRMTFYTTKRSGAGALTLNPAMCIGANGFVRIGNKDYGFGGVEEPYTKFTVHADTGYDAARFVCDAGYSAFSVGAAGKITIDSVGNPGGRFSILDNGAVGIGTAAPAAKLSIEGGCHVGGTSDPGDDNLTVDGTLLVVGQARGTALSACWDLGTSASVTNGVFIMLVPYPITVTSFIAYAQTAPTGGSGITIDVTKNGTSIFPTNPKVNIASGANTSSGGVPNTVSFTTGDIMSVNITTVGTTIAGGNHLLVDFYGVKA